VSSEPDRARPARRGLQPLLGGRRAFLLAWLLAVCAVAWAWIAIGASGRSATMGDMPGMSAAPAATLPLFAGLFAMWAIMMVAMMLPSAAPAILLYERVGQQTSASTEGRAQVVPAYVFASGYLISWTAFSAAAALLQLWLSSLDLVSTAAMKLTPAPAIALLLIAAGLYELSPWKRACLSLCRSPAQYFSRHWRPGIGGALRLGIMHGVTCIGCCWMLMLLLFVGGVMNLGWIALLAAVALVQKLAPWGPAASRLLGFGLMIAGVTVLGLHWMLPGTL